MKLKPLLILSIYSTVLAGCATAGADYQTHAKSQYAALSVDHFTKTMTINDDELETSAQFSTYKGSRPNASGDLYLSLVSNPNDEFMRAHVFKDSGKEVYQMYFLLSSSEWKRPSQINFTAGLGSKPTDRIAIDAKCTSASCTNFEDVIVNFTRSELERTVTTLDQSSEPLLKFRIKGQSGKDYDGSLSVNEIKAVLQAVEKHKIES